MSLGYNSNVPSEKGFGFNSLYVPVTKKKSFISTSSSSSQQAPSVQPMQSMNKAMTLQDNAITQRRVEYLEVQLKKTQTELKEFANFEAKPNSGNLEYVHSVIGTADCNITSSENGTKIFSKGDNVHLIYPMKKDGTKTVMRAVIINPVTAQFSYSWITVFDIESGIPTRPVVNFRIL